MLLAYGNLETYGKDKRKRGVAELSAAWGVASTFWAKLVDEVKALEDDDDPFVQGPRVDKGVPKKYTEEIMSLVCLQANHWRYDFSYADMAQWLVDEGHLSSASGSG
eukprot:7071420-Prymnesium_polylepis.1